MGGGEDGHQALHLRDRNLSDEALREKPEGISLALLNENINFVGAGHCPALPADIKISHLYPAFIPSFSNAVSFSLTSFILASILQCR
jgi:hypothetical protein